MARNEGPTIENNSKSANAVDGRMLFFFCYSLDERSQVRRFPTLGR